MKNDNNYWIFPCAQQDISAFIASLQPKCKSFGQYLIKWTIPQGKRKPASQISRNPLEPDGPSKPKGTHSDTFTPETREALAES
ncbi:hypothetical protein [Bifidobacterium sp. ESL0800]|uniref:hypothetical protein n=1 Tax=Bifidobacterium sp. ESL0800 TaxID=2983236 RepID=UPI0023F975A4|nr:hypothetical protein [Bifidobacterium sp. ESL0800]WEV75470.1 hypothetical protein OZX75_07575 [Bifidobacterium sp. ESL0800]